MDMLYSLSLYPVNALAQDDSKRRIKRESTDYWREADEYMMVTPITPARSATQTIRQNKAPKRDAFTRSNRVFKITPVSPPLEYQLSHQGVLARK